MRIALISYEFPPVTLGGIGTYADHTVRLLSGRGHEVVVFCGSPTPAPERQVQGRTTVIRLFCGERRAFHAAAVDALQQEHQRKPFEIAEVPDLYAEGAGLRRALPTLPLVLRAHTPCYVASAVDFRAVRPLLRGLRALRRVVGGVRHPGSMATALREAAGRVSFRYHYGFAGDPERSVAAEADLVLPPSHRLAERLRKDWRLPPERVRVLPYAHLPSPALLALPLPEAGRSLGFHGGVRLFKGIHVLVAAMPTLLARHPELQLAIAGASGSSPVGDCSWSAWRHDRMLQWRDTVDWLGPQLKALGTAVQLRGFVPPERLPEHLAGTDICVFPSLFDNFPSACLEAMSAGRAIVATRSGGMEEMLDHGRAGLLVPPGDVAALAAAVSRLVQDSGLRKELATRARARVLSAYGAAVIGPKYEDAYEEAMDRASVAAA